MSQEPMFHPHEYAAPKQVLPRFPKGYFNGKKRPGLHDDEIKRFVAEDILPPIKEWFGEEEWEYQGEGEVHKALMDVIDPHDDGYAMARELERAGWESNSELVEILDGLDFWTIHREATNAWREDNNIQPRFSVGALVKVNPGSPRSKVSVDGEIIEVDLPRAQYHVFIESLGHIRRNSGKTGTTALCLDWEAVEALNPVATEGL